MRLIALTLRRCSFMSISRRCFPLHVQTILIHFIQVFIFFFVWWQKNITSNHAKSNKNLPRATNSQSHVLFHTRFSNSSSFFFLLKSKRTSKKHIPDGGQRRTASENIVDISKDYELNNICHENIIAPINKLWLKELDMTKSVQW